jgi:hypothetical protein
MKKIIIGSLIGVLVLIAVLQGVAVARVHSLYNKKEYAKASDVMDKVWIPGVLGDMEERLYVLGYMDTLYRKSQEYSNGRSHVDETMFIDYSFKTIAVCIGQSERSKEYGVSDIAERIKDETVRKLSSREYDVEYGLRNLKADETQDWYFAPLVYEDESAVDRLISELRE